MVSTSEDFSLSLEEQLRDGSARMTRLARSNDPAQVLVIGPSWVGDMVMAQVLFQIMRRRWPRVQIDLLAPPASSPLGERMAELRQVYTLEIPHGRLGMAARRTMAERLRPVEYDWAICLPNTFKSALIPYWLRIPVRSGFKREFRGWLLNDAHRLQRRKLPRTVDQYVSLGLPPRLPHPNFLPPPRLQVDTLARDLACKELGLPANTRPVALAPGAEYGPAKRWPLRHWIRLATELVAAGHAVWLFGSPKDAPITREIAAAVPAVVDLGGRTSLLQALDLLSLAPVAVSNDSGLMHVAGAVGSRVVALYGPTSPLMTPPLSPGAQILRREISCSPCGKRECPRQHHRCMEELEAGPVLAQVEQLLAASA
jgi:heptosyltransferase-2